MVLRIGLLIDSHCCAIGFVLLVNEFVRWVIREDDYFARHVLDEMLLFYFSSCNNKNRSCKMLLQIWGHGYLK